MFYFWTAAEDIVMSSWLTFALQHKPNHLSLHYDGMRVQLPLGVTVEDFCKQCSARILAVSPADMNEHKFASELISDR